MRPRESRTLPLGIDPLDRQLGGGIPSGSIIAFAAPPASQSEIVLYELTSARPSLYLSTSRTEEAVTDAFNRARCPTGDPVIHRIPPEAPIQHAFQLMQSVTEQSNLIIDPIDPLEAGDRNTYRNFLNALQTHMINTDSIAILHCLTGPHTSERRTDTLHMADGVFELSQRVDGAEIETRLAILKLRGGNTLSETIKLELSDRVHVDTSRDIA